MDHPLNFIPDPVQPVRGTKREICVINVLNQGFGTALSKVVHKSATYLGREGKFTITQGTSST